MKLLGATLVALLLHSANAVHFDAMSVVCAMHCDWGMDDLRSCEQRDNYASCVDKCGQNLPLKYMKRSHQEYRDIFCKIRNNSVNEAVHEAMVHFGASCMPQDDECAGLLKCLGAIRMASEGKQGVDNDILKLVGIENVLQYIISETADPQLDIPQRCADTLSGKDAAAAR